MLRQENHHWQSKSHAVLQEQAGLCYQPCSSGFNGVGPGVCWGNIPNGWVQCGMGAALDSDTCRNIIFSQISAVGNLALTIGTLGTSAAATEAAEAGKISELVNELKGKWTEIKEMPEVKNAIETGKDILEIKKIIDFLNGLYIPSTIEESVRLSAQAASFFDTTGLSSTLASFTYAKCSTTN
jgi:hypothetical protein